MVSIFDIGKLQLVSDTTQATNGAYPVIVEAQLAESRLSNAPPVTLVVSNAIWFPDSFNVAGYYVEVQAQSIHANGTYQVHVYDDTGFNTITVSGTNDSQGFITYGGSRGFLIQNFNSNT